MIARVFFESCQSSENSSTFATEHNILFDSSPLHILQSKLMSINEAMSSQSSGGNQAQAILSRMVQTEDAGVKLASTDSHADEGQGESKVHDELSMELVPYNPFPFLDLTMFLQIDDPTLRAFLLAGRAELLEYPQGADADHFHSLPQHHPRLVHDIVPTILSYCDALTLARASGVCRQWRTLASSNAYWERLCRAKFGVCPDQIRPRPDPAKLLYVLTHRSLREACRAERVNPFTGRHVGGRGIGFRQRISLGM